MEDIADFFYVHVQKECHLEYDMITHLVTENGFEPEHHHPFAPRHRKWTLSQSKHS